MRYFLIIFLFCNLAFANEQSISDYLLTEQCEKTVIKEGFTSFEVWEDKSPISFPVVTRGEASFSINKLRLAYGFYGLLFQANGQQIIHCTPDKHTPDFILVERSIGYSMFLLEEFELTRFLVHHYVGCGTSCYYSTVETIEIPDETNFKPIGKTEIQSRLYDYPNSWFRVYLSEDEQKILDEVNG